MIINMRWKNEENHILFREERNKWRRDLSSSSSRVPLLLSSGRIRWTGWREGQDEMWWGWKSADGTNGRLDIIQVVGEAGWAPERLFVFDSFLLSRSHLNLCCPSEDQEEMEMKNRLHQQRQDSSTGLLKHHQDEEQLKRNMRERLRIIKFPWAEGRSHSQLTDGQIHDDSRRESGGESVGQEKEGEAWPQRVSPHHLHHHHLHPPDRREDLHASGILLQWLYSADDEAAAPLLCIYCNIIIIILLSSPEPLVGKSVALLTRLDLCPDEGQQNDYERREGLLVPDFHSIHPGSHSPSSLFHEENKAIVNRD